jgi:hypothetical protein
MMFFQYTILCILILQYSIFSQIKKFADSAQHEHLSALDKYAFFRQYSMPAMQI